MKKKAIPVFIGILCWILSAEAMSSFWQEKQERSAADYRIGPRDKIEIKVFGQDKYNTTTRVSEEGKITLTMLGEVVVEGLTAMELEKRLSQLLEKYLRNPEVSVAILEHQSKLVSVLGAVQAPGFKELIGRQTLLQVITAASGLTRDAGKEIIIIRQLSDDSSTTIHIPIDNLMLKGDPKFNIPVEPGDTIIVQVDRVVQIYMSGEVKTPGALQVMKSRIPTLTQAIAQAGGFTDLAKKRSVVVKRRDEKGIEKNFEINVIRIQDGKEKDFQLEENDVVIIPKTWF